MLSHINDRESIKELHAYEGQDKAGNTYLILSPEETQCGLLTTEDWIGSDTWMAVEQ